MDAALDPFQDVSVSSIQDGNTVHVDTTNVASLTIDGAALMSRGIESVTINGETRVLEDGSFQVGNANAENP